MGKGSKMILVQVAVLMPFIVGAVGLVLLFYGYMRGKK